ncbi:MAG: class I SAM-dependent methyltransferase [Defluviitaleaceae bacterium]|nr:class I SAM-dependent methyltransferase [Defluviitaleaceae bacterium]MCL2835700.1 class I SAM-dependent methyltransferase [Defluviitaleaceae bacterium]
MNGPYGGFAALYDEFMAGTDYTGWADYIEKIFVRFDASPKLLLDLGCGTGSATRLFSARGYDMIGLDSSAEMLSIAKGKDPDNLYILQDMRSFELYGTVDAIISTCDVLNYLLTPRDLYRVFRLAANYLNPGGLFIFDMNTRYKYRRVLGNRTFARQTNKAAFIWNNRYYPKQCINEYRLTFFRKQENGLFARFRERHTQRAYPPGTICGLLKAAGLNCLAVYGEKTFAPPKSDTERVFYVAQR